ncbi:MAG: PIG-L deacetylase family protein [Candidatus Helarchaeota archaeon]
MSDVVLAISAHPDDIEFLAGGTLVQFQQQGMEIYYLITTNGQRGSLEPGADPQTIIETRRQEAQAAGKIIGVKEIFNLGYEDGFLDQVPHLELRKHYIYHIRKLRPRIVMTFDPWNPYEPHSDHRKTALAAYESCYFCHYPLFHPEFGLPKHFVSEIWLFRTHTPNKWVPLTAKELRIKIKALLQHKSQMHMLVQEIREQLQAEQIDTTLLEQMGIQTLVDIFVRNIANETGKSQGYRFAESFLVRKIGYAEDVKKVLKSLSA